MRRTVAIILLIWLGISPAGASVPTLPPGFEPLGATRVADVVDGDTVVLADGRQVRLVGIQAPKLSLGRAHVRDWPLAADAKAALQRLATNQRVTLHTGGTAEDRHSRVLAHLVRAEDNLWIQGEILRQGMARVYTFADNRRGAAAMLALEQQARAARRGIWAHPYYAIRTPGDVGRRLDHFEIAEGRIRAVAEVKGRIYLNFGDDWRTDFTVLVPRQARKSFHQAALDLTQWPGKLIRVRGWVSLQNGPLIEAGHPEQIELLNEGETPP